MPFAIVNRVIEEFNTNGISAVLRADNILDYQMSSPSDTFGLTQFQKESLKEQKILPLDYGGGTVLAYEVSFSPNEWKIVHGTTPASPNVSDLQSQYSSTYSGFTFSRVSLVSIADALEDGDFKNPYTTASKTWRGGNSGWYDTLTSLNESIRGLQRSRFFAAGASKFSTVSVVAARRVMKGRTIGDVGDTVQETVEVEHIGVDAQGQEYTYSTTEQHISESHKTGFNKGLLKAAAVLNGVSKVTDAACGVVEIANKIQTIVQAFSNMQQMNLVTGYTEAVQKVQTGDDGGGVAMHEYANNLTTKDESGKSAIESAGIGAMFSGDVISSNDESVKTATAEGAFANLGKSSNPVSQVISSAIGAGTNFLDAMTRCTYIKGAVSVISAIFSVAAVATGGIAAVIEFGVQLIIGGVVSFVIAEVKDALIDWFWDSYGEVLEKDLATAIFGEDLGNALTSGANKYLSSNHQVGGGSPATKNGVISFRRQQEIVLAEEAEYQRSIRSPFDIGSEHTFLGSIVHSLIPLANTSSAGSIVKTMGGVIRNSVTDLLPSASAIAETNLISSFGDCPTLDSIGIVGDAYCNPYFISDTSTNTSVAMLKKLNEYDTVAANGYWHGTGNGEYIEPDDIVDAVYTLGGLEGSKEEGARLTTITDRYGKQYTGYKIITNSNLDKFAKYCGARTSDWGFADANIAEQISEQNQKNDWWRQIPIIGDAIGAIVDIIHADENKQWISGYNCVAREYNPSCKDECDKSKECFWQNEGRYYQRFIEDQRYIISAQSDTITGDPVSLLLNDYYYDHPLDQSFEGILARYSGMTKDDVIATLDLIEGLNYIANYHPEERMDFLAAIDGSLRTIPQTPAVEITNVHRPESEVTSSARLGLNVVILTSAGRPACGERSDGPVRRESCITA